MSAVTEWSAHESALWWTCNFVRDLTHSGRLPPPLPVAFVMRHDQNEFVYQWGNYGRSWFGAEGSAGYRTSWLVAGGFSPLGIGLGALTLGASAALNANRRARANQAATPMWRPCDSGAIYISTHGYYMANQHGILPFAYNGHVSANLVQPGVIQCDMFMADGSQQRFATSTNWAELIFVTWALKHCPNHPQLQNLGWLPREFIERIRDAGIWQTSALPELMSD
jgi:hypothetical protein